MSGADLVRYKILIRDYTVQVDVHPFVAGVSFDEVAERSEESAIMGVPVRVPCLDDLIQMKRAAGRTKDLEDLKYLREVQKSSKKSDS